MADARVGPADRLPGSVDEDGKQMPQLGGGRATLGALSGASLRTLGARAGSHRSTGSALQTIESETALKDESPTAGGILGGVGRSNDDIGDKDEDLNASARLASVVASGKGVKLLAQRSSFQRFEKVLRGRKGSFDEGDNDVEKLEPDWYVFDPYSKFRLHWDMVSVTFIFINALMIPVWVSFELEPSISWKVFDAAVDIFFVCDLFLNFVTGYVDDGELVMQGKATAKHYAKTWLVIDVIATTPYNFFAEAVLSGDENLLQLPEMIRFVRMLRLVRLMRLLRVGSRLGAVLEMGMVSKSLFRILKLMFWVIVIGHVSGCFWVLVASIDGYGPQSWTTVYGVDQNSFGEVYVSAVYWAIATLTTCGYGDISAYTDLERMYSIVLMVIGAVVFAVVVGRMSALAALMNRDAAARQKIADDVHEFMRWRQLPKPLRVRMREYYSYHLEDKALFDEKAILNDLSPALRRDIILFINREIVRSVPFLRDADPAFISEMAQLLYPVKSIPGDYIILAGEVGKEFFMLKSGEVEVISREGIIMRVLGQGTFFGEISLLEGCRRTVSVRARTNCDMLALSKTDFRSVIAQFPTFAEALRTIAMARKNGEVDPDVKNLKRADPPFGKASWEEFFHSSSSNFLKSAQKLASQLKATKTVSTWHTLKQARSMYPARTASSATLNSRAGTFVGNGKVHAFTEDDDLVSEDGESSVAGGGVLAAIHRMESKMETAFAAFDSRLAHLEDRLPVG